jgi:hypothetical protein
LVLCQRPLRLSARDGEQWLREQAASVLADDPAGRVQVTTLRSLSPAWPLAWDYLITIEPCASLDAAAVSRGRAFIELLGDLRVLGMHPDVVVADDARITGLGAGRV